MRYMMIYGTYSGRLDINRDVPQDSVLGPLLFCLYINDLLDIWVKNNELCINPTKSKCTLINGRNRKIVGDIRIKIDTNLIEFVNCSKNFGIIFNNKLTWSNHIVSAIGKIYGMLRNLWAVKCSTPFKIRILPAKTYLIPELLYRCEIYVNFDANDLRKLKVAYNNIARYIFNRGIRDSISMFSFQISNMCFENLFDIFT